MAADDIEQFWQAYLATLPADERDQTYLEADSWGNSPELADEIARLIHAGEKTTTSRLEWDRVKSGDALQQIGDKCIVLDAAQTPVCITEVVEVFIRPFNQVDADFVYRYGEGTRDMAFWNNNMWDYYVEECAAIGMPPAPDMPMICEVFKVIYRPG